MRLTFLVGDVVQVKPSYPGRMDIKSWVGTVISYRVEQDASGFWKQNCQVRWAAAFQGGDYASTWNLHEDFLTLLMRGDDAPVKPPAFTSVREADEWMANRQQAQEARARVLGTLVDGIRPGSRARRR